MTTFSERLKEAMNAREFKQSDLSKASGLDKSLISNYLSGNYKARQENLHILAKALGVTEAWLMGYDVPMVQKDSEIDVRTFDNIFPIETVRIPFLGDIACGEPIYADEDRESYVLAGTGVKADFCLRAKGDSMKNARILDGDIVFIRKQEMVDNGEIAAVIIEDEATLKRIYYYREENLLILRADNPSYKDQIYKNSDLDQIKILGKAVAFQSDAI